MRHARASWSWPLPVYGGAREQLPLESETKSKRTLPTEE